MIKKKIWTSLVAICIIGGLALGAYKAVAMASSDMVTSSRLSKTAPPAIPLFIKEAQEKAPITEGNTGIGNTVTVSSVQPVVSDQIESGLNNLVATGKFVRATENGVYPQKKGIIINDEIIVALEGYRIIVDEASYSTDKYYMVADLSIFNISNTDYLSSPSNFMLSDSDDYTYTPTLGANTTGDILGDLKFKESRRGEIAFYVPEHETNLKLHLNTGIDAVKTISFTINTNSLVNPPLPGYQALN